MIYSILKEDRHYVSCFLIFELSSKCLQMYPNRIVQFCRGRFFFIDGEIFKDTITFFPIMFKFDFQLILSLNWEIYLKTGCISSAQAWSFKRWIKLGYFLFFLFCASSDLSGNFISIIIGVDKRVFFICWICWIVQSFFNSFLFVLFAL